MVRIPILRGGRPYWSVETVALRDHRTGEPVAEVSQANTGLIARDLALPGEGDDLPRFARLRDGARALREIPARDLVRMCREAARHFRGSTLPLGDDPQSPEDYLRDLSRTTGLPRTLAKKSLEKIAGALDSIEAVLAGLTRGLDLEVLDGGVGRGTGRLDGYSPLASVLGAVLPSNSPGVHGLWLPAVALKTALALKPGREEPWTPHRLVQAFLRAGAPPAAFSFYPSGHEAASEILRRADRSLLFGDSSTTRPWQGDPRIQLHGPGHSKVILGPDEADRWEEHLDLIQSSIAENGGRSCINASGVWTPRHGREIAEALARRLAAVEPLDPDDDRATLAAFPDPQVARRISSRIDQALDSPGAGDLTRTFRGSPRLAERGGATYLLPTILWCSDPEHTLANTEYLFPFASVVEVPAGEVLARIGPTLVATVITRDPAFAREALDSPDIDRLNLGPIPTWRISWDQPHEGNLFELLYRRRSLEVAGSVPPGSLGGGHGR